MKFTKSVLAVALPTVLAATTFSTAQAASLGQPHALSTVAPLSIAVTADRPGPAMLTNVAETRPSDSAAPTTTPKTGSKAATEAQRKAEDAKRAETERKMERIEAAKPLDETSAPVKKVMGADVRNTAYAQVATVEDLKLKDGKISEVIISTGGFLGMGADYYQVSIDKVRFYSDEDETFVLIDVTKESLKQFAQVEKKNDLWVVVGKQSATDRPATNSDAPTPDTKAPAAEPKKGQTDREMKAPEPADRTDDEKQQ